MRASRVLSAGVFGLGYLVNSGGLGAAAAQAPPPSPVVTLTGTLTDTEGQVVAGRDLDVMLLEHRSPAEVEAGADQLATVLDGGTTDGSGHFAVDIPLDAVPAGYVGPDGVVTARLISPEAGSAVFQVADFDVDGDHGSGPVGVALEATVQPAPGQPATGAEGAAIDGYDYCDFVYESYGWEDTGLGARPFVSVGRIFTRGGTAIEVGVYNGSQHRNESFVSVGGGYFRGGVVESADTSVDWSILFPTNTNVDLQAEMQYRHHQLFCQNLNTGARRYPNVGEYYPYRPTAGTRTVPMSGEPFACYRSTDHAGNQKVTVSRGRTRTTSDSFSIAGVGGRVSLALSTSDSTTSTTINRLTVHGQRAYNDPYTLCGSDDIPVYATWVREK